MKQRYHISGMTCSACSSHVEKAANKLEGVRKASVNLLTETMEIEYDENILPREAIEAAVEKAGYGASLIIGGRHTAGGGKEGSARGQDSSRDSGCEGGKGSCGYARNPDGGDSVSTAGNRGRQSVQRKAREETRAMKRRLGISIGFLIPLMYVAMYHMYNQWFGLPIPGFVHRFLHGNENAMTFAMTQFILLLPILYMNRKFFSVGFKTLRHLSPNMDSLIALGASAAIGYGIFAMYRISYGLGHGDMAVVEQYAHDLYFESAGMILTLITVGKYLESRSKGKTSEAITKLMDLSPKTAIVVDEEGREREIPTEELRSGDIFLVKPGSLVPVDGTVLEGNSSIDEAAVTGESIPVEKQPGDKVVSATVNKAGFLKCRADRVGEDTTLAQIIRLVEEASASKAPIARLADQVAGVFVPVVIGIALVTLAAWLIAGAGAEFAISSAIAVLVISCPCALGLATPVAIMVGTGVGARHGILIKSGEALQQAKEIDTVVLDKTGTLTSGKLHVSGTGCYVQDMSLETMVSIAAALEKRSEHPLAEAIVAYAEREKLELPEIRDFRAVFGRGVEGVLAEDIAPRARVSRPDGSDGPTAVFLAGKRADGSRVVFTSKADENTKGAEGLKEWADLSPEDQKSAAEFLTRAREVGQAQDAGAKAGTRYYVGNRAYMEENGIVIDETVARGLDSIAQEGRTPLLVGEEGRLLGCIDAADQIKGSSCAAVQKFREMGIHVVMLTGDNRRTAEAVKRQLGMEEAVAEVLPQDKERKIRQLKESGRKVAMVGDGINDAPALTAADVGMAIGAGTDVAMESADIVLMKSDLRDAVTAIGLSRAVIRNIKQNLFWAFFYNAIGIPLAAGVWYPAFGIRLNPMFGAAAMSLSSIFVVGNALRLRGFRSGFPTMAAAEDSPSPAEGAGKAAESAAEGAGKAAESAVEGAGKAAESAAEGAGKAAEEAGEAAVSAAGKAPDAEGEGVTAEQAGEAAMEQAETEGKTERLQAKRSIKQESEDNKMTKVMTIEGMMCGHCTGRVQKALEAVAGVSTVTMSLEDKTATVELAGEVGNDVLTGAVSEAGYEVTKIE